MRQLGGADLAYCFPRCGALVNHIPIAVRESRGGRLPLQFMDAGTEQGGLAVFTRARDDRGFSYRLEKGTAITMAVESDSTPNRAFVSVPVEIRAHAGDWHVAFDDYRAWLATWFRAAAPPKAWFRGAFTLRQQFLRSSAFGDGTYLRDGRLTFREGLAADALAFGGIGIGRPGGRPASMSLPQARPPRPFGAPGRRTSPAARPAPRRGGRTLRSTPRRPRPTWRPRRWMAASPTR